jgi:hypothetical protein
MRQAYFTAIGAALGGAAIAAFVGMGTAQADYPINDDGFQILFGAPSTAGLEPGQLATNVTSDANLTASNPGLKTVLSRFRQNFSSFVRDQLVGASGLAVKHPSRRPAAVD